MNLPKDWVSSRLEELSDKISDGLHATPKYTEDSNIYFVNGNNIKDGRISIFDGTKKVPESEWIRYRKDLGDNTILLSINGTIGSLAFYRGEKVVLGKSAAYINVKPQFSKEYIYYLLDSRQTKLYFDFELTGSAIKNLSLKAIKKLPMLMPPLAEQKKIASILSTWDNAIDNQVRLIEKSKTRMRQLAKQLCQANLSYSKDKTPLTNYRMQDIFESISRRSADGLEEPLAVSSTLGLVSQRQRFKKVIAGKSLENYVVVMKDDFTYNKGNSKDYKCGRICRIENFDTGLVPNVYISFRIKRPDLCDSTFIKYFFEADLMAPLLSKIINTGVRNDGLLNLKPEHFFQIRLMLPPLEIQKKIARLLKIVSADFANKKHFLALLREQKQGLMQELLTGKVRVKG